MNEVVKKIIESKLSKNDKFQALEKLRDDIRMADDILSGKFVLCEDCNDYYLVKSFTTEKETEPTQILVYSDPINSGGNEYADGYADITYRICPKGHRKQIHRSERRR